MERGGDAVTVIGFRHEFRQLLSCPFGIGFRRHPQVEPQHREVRDNIETLAAVEGRHVDGHIAAGGVERVTRRREAGGRGDGIAALGEVASGVGCPAANDDGEVARPLASAGERAGLVERGLEQQAHVVAGGRVGERSCRAGRAELFVGVDEDFPAEPVDWPESREGLEGHEHHGEAPLGVGHARSAEHAAVAGQLNPRRFGARRIHRIHVDAEEHAGRVGRAVTAPHANRIAERHGRLATTVSDRRSHAARKPLDRPEHAEGVAHGPVHLRKPVRIKAPRADSRPGAHDLQHPALLPVDPLEHLRPRVRHLATLSKAIVRPKSWCRPSTTMDCSGRDRRASGEMAWAGPSRRHPGRSCSGTTTTRMSVSRRYSWSWSLSSQPSKPSRSIGTQSETQPAITNASPTMSTTRLSG